MDVRNGHKNRKTHKKNKCFGHIFLCVMLALTIAVTANIGILPVMALSSADMGSAASQEPAGDTEKQDQSGSGADTVTTDGTAEDVTSESEANGISDSTGKAATGTDATGTASNATGTASDSTGMGAEATNTAASASDSAADAAPASTSEEAATAAADISDKVSLQKFEIAELDDGMQKISGSEDAQYEHHIYATQEITLNWTADADILSKIHAGDYFTFRLPGQFDYTSLKANPEIEGLGSAAQATLFQKDQETYIRITFNTIPLNWLTIDNAAFGRIQLMVRPDTDKMLSGANAVMVVAGSHVWSPNPVQEGENKTFLVKNFTPRTDSKDLTDTQITDFTITDETGTEPATYYTDQYYDINIGWKWTRSDDTPWLIPGDWFEILLPSEFSYQNYLYGGFTNSFDIKNEAGDVIATGVINPGGTIKVTFSDKISKEKANLYSTGSVTVEGYITEGNAGQAYPAVNIAGGTSSRAKKITVVKNSTANDYHWVTPKYVSAFDWSLLRTVSHPEGKIFWQNSRYYLKLRPGHYNQSQVPIQSQFISTYNVVKAENDNLTFTNALPSEWSSGDTSKYAVAYCGDLNTSYPDWDKARIRSNRYSTIGFQKVPIASYSDYDDEQKEALTRLLSNSYPYVDAATMRERFDLPSQIGEHEMIAIVQGAIWAIQTKDDDLFEEAGDNLVNYKKWSTASTSNNVLPANTYNNVPELVIQWIKNLVYFGRTGQAPQGYQFDIPQGTAKPFKITDAKIVNKVRNDDGTYSITAEVSLNRKLQSSQTGTLTVKDGSGSTEQTALSAGQNVFTVQLNQVSGSTKSLQFHIDVEDPYANMQVYMFDNNGIEGNTSKQSQDFITAESKSAKWASDFTLQTQIQEHYTLPNTGGSGTEMFSIGGLTAILLAFLLFIIRHKTTEEVLQGGLGKRRLKCSKNIILIKVKGKR
ncbi:MAG: Ig-like domain-containing protein [Eubacterium sp.]|nr:Ig-like domain-containing protein [Eubacterium sp.]